MFQLLGEFLARFFARGERFDRRLSIHAPSKLYHQMAAATAGSSWGSSFLWFTHEKYSSLLLLLIGVTAIIPQLLSRFKRINLTNHSCFAIIEIMYKHGSKQQQHTSGRPHTEHNVIPFPNSRPPRKETQPSAPTPNLPTRFFGGVGRMYTLLEKTLVDDPHYREAIESRTEADEQTIGRTAVVCMAVIAVASAGVYSWVTGSEDETQPVKNPEPVVSCEFSDEEPYLVKPGQGIQNLTYAIDGIDMDSPCYDEAEQTVLTAIQEQGHDGQIWVDDTIYIPGSVEVVSVSQ